MFEKSDTEYCHKCDRDTQWDPTKGGNRLKCISCGDVFPCYSDCAHLDCLQVATGEWFKEEPKQQPKVQRQEEDSEQDLQQQEKPRGKRQCGACGEFGHNRRTCPWPT